MFGSDFFVVETFGEGSCFFHALANALIEGYDFVKNPDIRRAYGTALRRAFMKSTNEDTYAEAMAQVASKLKALEKIDERTPELSMPPYSVFRTKFQTTSAWADLVMIAYVAHRYNMNLMFWNEEECAFYFGVDALESAEKENIPTIFINWHQHTHFELIVRIKKDENLVERQFFYKRDPKLFSRVKQAYYGKQHIPSGIYKTNKRRRYR